MKTNALKAAFPHTIPVFTGYLVLGISSGVLMTASGFPFWIPIVTSLAGLLPSLFSGAIITEQIFDLPGIGNTAYKAMIVGDVPVIMGYNMFLALLSIIGVLLADLMYAVVDPRVKLQ